MAEGIIKDQLIIDLENALSEDLEKVIFQEDEKAFALLKIKAQNFLDDMNKIENEKKKYFTEIKQLIATKNLNAILNLSTKEDKDHIALARLQYVLAFKFGDYIDAYLNKKQKRVGAVINAQFNSNNNSYSMKSYEVSLTELISKMSPTASKNGIRSKLQGFNKTDFITKYENNTLEDASKKAKRNKEAATKSYIGAKNRLQAFYKLSGKYGGNEQKGGWLLWLDSSGKWQGGKVANDGILAEAYLAFLMKGSNKYKNIGGDNEEFNFGELPYYSHRLIENFYKNYIGKVDNTPAVLEEDIETTDKAYAAKKEGADLPNLSQYITAAQVIIRHKEDKFINKSKLKKEIRKEFNIQPINKMFSDLDKEIEKSNNKDVIDTLKKLIVNNTTSYGGITISLDPQEKRDN